jgi:uncharacterized protein (DUF4415 family)
MTGLPPRKRRHAGKRVSSSRKGDTRRRRGPQEASTKVFTGIRLDADVIDAFKATGPGWQTRMNAALREWLEAHRPV